MSRQVSEPRRAPLHPSSRRGSSSRRGFTMVELLAVIAMVGLLAAASAPTFILLLQDRRVADATAEVTNLFRFARARAMGRGTAVDVRFYNAPAALTALGGGDPRARFVVKEAILGGGALDADHATIGTPNCLGTDWNIGGTTSRYLTSFDERRVRYEPAVAEFFNSASAQVADDVDVCFTPRGRTWVRYGLAGAWTDTAGVPFIQVTNTKSGMLRRVIIPPSGAARLVSEI